MTRMAASVPAGTTQSAVLAQSSSESRALQAAIKDEPADDYDLFGEEEHDEDTYKPRPQLPKPNVHMRSLADLIKGLEDGSIDVDPEYQREVVWTAERMTGLINSLMENFYIPPIILNKKTLPKVENGRPLHRLVCVDGKQRLSSVRAFVKGMIPCHDHRGQKWWFSDSPEGHRKKKILPAATQRMFLDKDFVAFEFTNLSSEQEEDLFARVQMGLQLTLAEKMRASTGPWQELARLFVDDFPTIYGLMKDRARAKDFQLTLSCFSQILEVLYPGAADGIPTMKTGYTALPRLLGNTGAVDDKTKSHLATVWNTFKNMLEEDPDTFTNANKYLKGVQTFAPVEMVGVAVLISMYHETRNNKLMLGDIRALRHALRENFVDLRLKPPVWKFIWDFIENLEDISGIVTSDNGSLPQQSQASAPSRTAAASPKVVSVPPRLPSRPVATMNEKVLAPSGPATSQKTQNISNENAKDPRLSKRKRKPPLPSLASSSTIDHPNYTVPTSYFPSATTLPSIQPSPSSHTSHLSPYPPMPTHPPPPSTVLATTTAFLPRPSAQIPSAYPPMPTHPPPPLATTTTSSSRPSTQVFSPPQPPTTTPRTLFAPDQHSPHWDGHLSPLPVPYFSSIPNSLPNPPNTQSTRLTAQQPPPKRRKSKVQSHVPTPGHDAVIDLTSDTEMEQEARDLLSAFKTKGAG
ncbi:hypothetical protein ACN47E_007886 [Coniothyrium glycines]